MVLFFVCNTASLVATLSLALGYSAEPPALTCKGLSEAKDSTSSSHYPFYSSDSLAASVGQNVMLRRALEPQFPGRGGRCGEHALSPP